MLATLPIVMGLQFLLQAVGLDIQGQPSECVHRGLVLGQADPEKARLPTPSSDGEVEEMPPWRQRAA